MHVGIGGLGGSGTRLVSRILSNYGAYGSYFNNEYYDNLLFTLLFKNPTWFKSVSSIEVSRRYELFRNFMEGGKMKFSTLKQIYGVANESELVIQYRGGILFYILSKNYLLNILNKKKDKWFWKEPNSHIMLKDIIKESYDLKYIYVNRHGIDMAFSNNRQQLENWRVKKTPHDKSIECQQLDFWIESTQRIFKLRSEYPNQVYVLNFNNLCIAANQEIRALFKFLNWDLSESNLLKLAKLPDPLLAQKKFTKEDLKKFSSSQLKAVEQFGFKL